MTVGEHPSTLLATLLVTTVKVKDSDRSLLSCRTERGAGWCVTCRQEKAGGRTHPFFTSNTIVPHIEHSPFLYAH